MGLHDKVLEGFDGCHLCVGLYKSPKILNCLHSFCTDCLEKHVDQSLNPTELICQSCGQVTQLGYQGVRGLTSNPFIIRKQYLKGLQLQVESNQTSPHESLDESSDQDGDVTSEEPQFKTKTQLSDSLEHLSTKENGNYYRVNPPTPSKTALGGYFDFGCSTHKQQEKLYTRHLRNRLEDQAMHLRSEILGATDAIDVINQHVNNWLQRKSLMCSKIQNRSFQLQKMIQDEEAILLEQLENLSAEKEFLTEANTKKQELHTSLKSTFQAIAFTRQLLVEGTEQELTELGQIVKERLKHKVHENVFLNIPELKFDQPQRNMSNMVSELFGEIAQTSNETTIYRPLTRYKEIKEDSDEDLQVFAAETILVSSSGFSKIKESDTGMKNQNQSNGQESLLERQENVEVELDLCSTEQKNINNEKEGTLNRFMNLRSSLRERRNRILRAHSDSSYPLSPRDNRTTSSLVWDAHHALNKPKPRIGVRRHHTFNSTFPKNYETSLVGSPDSDSQLPPTLPYNLPPNDLNGNSQSILCDKQKRDVDVSSVKDNIQRQQAARRSLTLV